jgi:hypothetical protein
MASNAVFQRVGGVNPPRSVFDLSYTKTFTCDMGQLIPVAAEDCVPGDTFTISNNMVIRMMPLVAPILHEIHAYVHYFFVPYRILWEDFEAFLTGGPDGDNAEILPNWEPGTTEYAEGTLWDFFGFPIGVDPVGFRPTVLPKYAYNQIYNDYYRDQTLIEEIDITDNYEVLKRAWTKDFFTAALPWQQRGDAPALPITGETSAVWENSSFDMSDATNQAGFPTAASSPNLQTGNDANSLANARAFFAANTVDLATASAFDIADLRLTIQLQKWKERNARSGARYTEFLKAHFGVSPRDDRLDRAEYIGGSKTPVIISEVLQTSETATTPQGTLAGHGITVDGNNIGTYHCEEYGVIMGILSVMPEAVYQQGVDRNWVKGGSRFGFYFPEFANLSEQEILQAELYATGSSSENQTVFGYIGHWDHMRTRKNMVCSGMRSDAATPFDYWHLARDFDSAPALNQAFIECDPTKRIFAAPSEPGLLVHYANKIKAVRPLPAVAEPGLMDH